MIRFEDEELEAFALEEGSIAVPVEIHMSPEGAYAITTYRLTEPIAAEWKARFFPNLFSMEARQALSDALTSVMIQQDFEPSPDGVTPIRMYAMDPGEEPGHWLIQNGTVIVETNADIAAYPNELSQLPELEEACEEYCALHIEQGKIVACAALNDLHEEENALEIHVETAPDYRGRGFGASCVAALSQRLLEEGFGVRYLCRETNIASVRLVEKLGFRFTGIRQACVYYRRGQL